MRLRSKVALFCLMVSFASNTIATVLTGFLVSGNTAHVELNPYSQMGFHIFGIGLTLIHWAAFAVLFSLVWVLLRPGFAKSLFILAVTVFALAYITSATFLDMLGDLIVASGGSNLFAPPSFLTFDSILFALILGVGLPLAIRSRQASQEKVT